MGIARSDGGSLIMAFADGLVGRPGFLHGGAIAGLLENAGWVAVLDALPEGSAIKPIGITVDFMRGGRTVETRARATIERLGRRIANVFVIAWQDDETRPIATANMKFLVERAAAEKPSNPDVAEIGPGL